MARIDTQSPEFKALERKQPFYQWNEAPRGTKKPLWHVLQAGDWKDERCFLVGGGPSLIGFDFNRLEGQGRIIAINKAFLHVPFADMMLAMDSDFYQWLIHGELGVDAKAAFQVFKGLKVWVDTSNFPFRHGVRFVFKNRIQDISRKLEDGIYIGNNTGVAGVMLAAALGCNPIYLLGFDGKHKGNKSHYHSGYPRQQFAGTAMKFVRWFDHIAPVVKNAGIKVVNLNRQSAIRCFAFDDFEKVIHE